MPTDPRTRRYPCAWCGVGDRWPDRCGVYYSDPDEVCEEITGDKCEEGDHRRCDGAQCAVAADWHLDARRAGVLAARAAGTVWAVVSIIDGQVRVIGTTDHLGRAKSTLRTPAAKRGGFFGPAAKGAVYVVRESDGEFF